MRTRPRPLPVCLVMHERCPNRASTERPYECADDSTGHSTVDQHRSSLANGAAAGWRRRGPLTLGEPGDARRSLWWRATAKS